ncbi:Uma2 family endonuclease [bacterium]|nr:Uma2 family endonuclease [bacterium]
MTTLSETPVKKWTYADYLKLGGYERHEIISGEIFMAPSASTEHQRSSRKLEFLMIDFVEKNRLGEIFDAPYDVIFDKTNVVQPDLLFVSNSNSKIIQARGIFGVPDLVVEIVSPASQKMDKIRKKLLYQQFQVQEYWIVEPLSKTVEIFTLQNGFYELFCSSKNSSKLTSKILSGFEFEADRIFS